MFARSRWMFVAGLAALAMCCSGPPGDDAGTDAGQDAGHDAGEADAGPLDSGPDDPEWVSIAEGLPSFCRLERANHPERLDQLRLHFSPCSSGTNCTISDPIPGFASGWPVWLSVDGTYALAVANPGDGSGWIFVSPLDGRAPIAAYHGSGGQGCGLSFGALGGGRVAMASLYDQTATSFGASFFVAPIGDAGRIERTFFDDHTDFAGSFVQGLYVSESAIVLWDSGGFFADVSASTFAHIEDSANPGVVMDSVSVFGDTILVEVFDSPTYMAIGHAGVSGGAEYYRAGPGIDVQQPLSDGTDIGWLQMPTGSTPDDIELWTASFVQDPHDLAPRRVRTFQTWRHPRIGASTWVDIAVAPYRIEIYDLSDGRRRSYSMPDDIASQYTLFVSTDHIVYPVNGRLVQFDPRLLPYDDESTDAGVDGG